MFDLNQNQIASQPTGFRINAAMVPTTSPRPPLSDPMIARIPVMIDAVRAQEAYFPNGGRVLFDDDVAMTHPGKNHFALLHIGFNRQHTGSAP